MQETMVLTGTLYDFGMGHGDDALRALSIVAGQWIWVTCVVIEHGKPVFWQITTNYPWGL